MPVLVHAGGLAVPNMPTPRIISAPRDRAIVVAIVLLAAALRVAASILLPDQNFADAAGYRSSGLQLWSTGQLGA